MPADRAMSVVVRPGRLRHEMIRRGWAATDLARESRLSQATISAALAGRPVAEKSLALIAKALSRAPVLDVVDSLIMRERSDVTLD
jgi:transcriptional regulator with XRE-family HTH domain